MRKIIFTLLCGLLCTATLNAQTWQIGSPTPANVTATLNEGTLTITGTGAMEDFENTTAQPASLLRPFFCPKFFHFIFFFFTFAEIF